jgi:hypothetical protein
MNFPVARFGVVSIPGMLLALSLASAVHAQTTLPNPFPPTPPFPYPYPYPYWQSGFGPGAVLQGTASVIDAQGNLMMQQEQARIEREKATQAKLDTKRKTLDWENYEREHKWTYAQEQERNEGLRIMRLLQNPREDEVLSGSAMNTLLPYLTQLAQKGTQGRPVYLDPYELKKINVTGAGTGANAGVLGNMPLAWPIALRGPEQKKVDESISKAVAATMAGTLDFNEYQQAVKGVDQLQQSAKDKWNAEQMDTGSYLTSKHFLESLKNGLAVLQRPDAAKLLGGGISAQGNTVAELVNNMSSQGLRFVKALPGDESAYFGLYNSMLAFAAAGEGATGFRVRFTPPVLKTSSYPTTASQ